MGAGRGLAAVGFAVLLATSARADEPAHGTETPPVAPDSLRRIAVLAEPRAPVPHIVSAAWTLPVSNFSGDPLLGLGRDSFARACEAGPGSRVIGVPAGFARPVVRGFSGARVLTLDHGDLIAFFPWLDYDAPAADTRESEFVTVMRGPVGEHSGSDALGGEVYSSGAFQPTRGGPGGASVRARLESYAASVNRAFCSALDVRGADGAVGWQIAGVGRSAADLRSPSGRLAHTGFDALNGSAAIGVRGAAGKVALRLARDGGATDLLDARGSGEGDPARIARPFGETRHLDDTRIQLAGDYALAGLVLETRGQWQRHSLVETGAGFQDPGPPPLGAAPRSGAPINLHLDRYSLELMAHHLAGSESGTFGISGLVERTASRGRLAVVPDARSTSAGAFAAEHLHLAHWTIVLGAHGEFSHLETDASPELARRESIRDDRRFSGNVGVERELRSGLRVKANLGRVWRAPTLYELFARGPHFGASRSDLGSPSLGSERGLGADLGLGGWWRRGRFHAELTGFDEWVGDAIELMPTPEFRDTLPVFRYARTRERVSGLEARLQVYAAAGLAIRGEADVVRGENRDRRAPVPQIPPARAAIVIERRVMFERQREANLSARLEWTARRTRVSAFDLPTAAHARLDLAGSARRRIGDATLGVGLEVRNATNARYRDFLSRYRAVADEPGTNVVVRLVTAY